MVLQLKGEYKGDASAEGYTLEDGIALNLSDKDQKWLGLKDTLSSGKEKNMKILVTGANGYLGQGIVKELLDNGHNVVAGF